MMAHIPLMIVPLIVYNIVAMGFAGDAGTITDAWAGVVVSLPMLSGEVWQMTLGDLMITFGLFLLFFEIMKSTRIGSASIIDHLVSTLLFVGYLVEFLLVPFAAHAVFFLLMVITFVDVIAGFSVSIRAATRDVSLNDRY
jgi:hypothetical protein